MKRLVFHIYERQEILDRFNASLEVVKKFENLMANGKRLTDFGRFRYEEAKKNATRFSRYLQMDRKEYVLLANRLCDYISAPYTDLNGKEE